MHDSRTRIRSFRLLIAIAVSFTTPILHAELPLAVPGGLFVMPKPDDLQHATFNGRSLMLTERHVLVGIPIATEPGPHSVTLHFHNGDSRKHPFTVHPKTYTEQRLTIENQEMVTPPAERLERIRSETRQMREKYRTYAEPVENLAPVRLPVDGIVTSLFGHRRILNGQPRSPHSGLDVAADTGTPVLAPMPGTVTLSGDFYFNGNTLLLDHGQGLVTMYCHLSEIKAEPEQRVERGDVIGLVGATGRVTGAHLHWSVSLNGNRIDPMMLINYFDTYPDTPKPSSVP